MGSSVPISGDAGIVDECAGSAIRATRMPGELLLVASLFWPEAVLFVAFVAGRLQMSQYLLLHVGACAAAAALGACCISRSGAAEYVWSRTVVLLHATVWTLLAGPFGSFIVAALLVPPTDRTGGGARLPGRAAATHSELTRVEMLHSRLLDRRLRLEQAHHIRPLLDVMIEGTQMEKLDALRLIAKRYVPGLAPAVRRALEDQDASVRVFAATVIAQQNNAYTKQIGASQAIAAAAPESADHWLRLAQAHADYAASGLLETARAEAETRQARTYLTRATRLAASAQPA